MPKICNVKITYDRRGVLIENKSEDHRLIVYLVPEPPKRKWVKILIVEPESFNIFESPYNIIQLDSFAYMFENVMRTP